MSWQVYDAPAFVQAKSKKDAKQLAAAALLEVMLDHVPFQDLLYKSDKQQSFKDMQVRRRPIHFVFPILSSWAVPSSAPQIPGVPGAQPAQAEFGMPGVLAV